MSLDMKIATEKLKKSGGCIVGLVLGSCTIKIASKLGLIEGGGDIKLMCFKDAEDSVEGMDSKLKLFRGSFNPSKQTITELDNFLNEQRARCFNLIFINHSNNGCLSDFKLVKDILNKRKLLENGAVFVANIKRSPEDEEFKKLLEHLKPEKHSEELKTEERYEFVAISNDSGYILYRGDSKPVEAMSTK